MPFGLVTPMPAVPWPQALRCEVLDGSVFGAEDASHTAAPPLPVSSNYIFNFNYFFHAYYEIKFKIFFGLA
jgi:hypothetical protein